MSQSFFQSNKLFFSQYYISSISKWQIGLILCICTIQHSNWQAQGTSGTAYPDAFLLHYVTNCQTARGQLDRVVTKCLWSSLKIFLFPGEATITYALVYVTFRHFRHQHMALQFIAKLCYSTTHIIVLMMTSQSFTHFVTLQW